jgi:acyl carrier protein
MEQERDREIYEQVKTMLVKDLRLKIAPEDIKDSDLIFGGGLGLDSIDALELVVALEKRFKVRITDAKVGAEVLVSVDTIVRFIKKEQQKNG